MASYQPIKEWPEEDRPREKLLAKGPQALSETELLAIILRNGNASTGQSAIDHFSGVNILSSPYQLGRIFLQDGIIAHQRRAFNDGLRNQQSIERVFMMVWQGI